MHQILPPKSNSTSSHSSGVRGMSAFVGKHGERITPEVAYSAIIRDIGEDSIHRINTETVCSIDVLKALELCRTMNRFDQISLSTLVVSSQCIEQSIAHEFQSGMKDCHSELCDVNYRLLKVLLMKSPGIDYINTVDSLFTSSFLSRISSCGRRDLLQNLLNEPHAFETLSQAFEGEISMWRTEVMTEMRKLNFVVCPTKPLRQEPISTLLQHRKYDHIPVYSGFESFIDDASIKPSIYLNLRFSIDEGKTIYLCCDIRKGAVSSFWESSGTRYYASDKKESLQGYEQFSRADDLCRLSFHMVAKSLGLKVAPIDVSKLSHLHDSGAHDLTRITTEDELLANSQQNSARPIAQFGR